MSQHPLTDPSGRTARPVGERTPAPTVLPPTVAPPTDPARGPALGWDPAWSAAFDLAVGEPAPPGAVGPATRHPARVTRADRGACDATVVDPGTGRGGRTVSAAWSRSLDRAAAADPTCVPAAGDWVVLAAWADAGSSTTRWTVETVLPRRTAVVRAQVTPGSSHGQVLAANADVAAVVEGLAPDPDPARIERLLALAWSSGARPVVVLTKADLVPDAQAMGRDIALLAPGAEVVVTSAPAGLGMEALRSWLDGGATIALLGASGVGKSTLLNALVDRDGVGAVMRTQALRSDGKGRHTTVARELHLAPGGGAVLDTPGLRTVGLAGPQALDDVFAEVEELAADCRFGDCEHRTEPGCAVLAAIEAADLPQRRLDSYRKLQREAAYQAARVDARLRAAQAGRDRAQQRAYRRHVNRP